MNHQGRKSSMQQQRVLMKRCHSVSSGSPFISRKVALPRRKLSMVEEDDGCVFQARKVYFEVNIRLQSSMINNDQGGMTARARLARKKEEVNIEAGNQSKQANLDPTYVSPKKTKAKATVKYSYSSEYGAFWKCVTAGGVYMVTQLLKMLFLATFFPMGDEEDVDLQKEDQEVPFGFFMEFLKSTVDLADLAGLYFIMQHVSGKGQVKILVAGLGWAFAELIFTRIIFLWVGARGIEFDWKYIQRSLDSNISLVHFLTLACLVWLWSRRDVNSTLIPVLGFLTFICSYQSVVLDTLSNFFGIGVWTALGYKALTTLLLGVVTLQLHIGITVNDRY